ncbi:ketoacyl-ACP synthase III family protein [Dactylosporangium sp. NPDC049525]|uniref:ketoacyl-ACP synthase III family protein n=1 Tax=Dactylosporangium sp. NPDC049525 TaxID=3154730 RepID=UPI00341F5B81
MRFDELWLASVGTYIPPVLSVADAARQGWCDAEQDGWTGVAVAGDMAPVDLALRAARSAMARSGVDPADVGLLLHVTSAPQGPNGWNPQHYLEHHAIGRGVPAIELRQGSAGMLNAFDLAAGHLTRGPGAVLVTNGDNFGVEPATGYDPQVRWRYATNAGTNRGSILGDAGTAAVLSNRGGFARLRSIVNRSLSDLEEMYRGDERIFPPPVAADGPVRLGNRFAAYDAKGPGRLATALRRLRDARTETAEQALAEAGITAAEVARVLHVFAGDERYVKHVLKPLGIDHTRGMLEFGRNLGHLGSGDQVAALEHLVLTGQLEAGDRVLVMANGTGIAVGAAVLEIVHRPEWTA